MLEKFRKLSEDLENIDFPNYASIENIKQKGKAYLNLAFIDSKEYIAELESILLIPKFKGDEKKAWDAGKTELLIFLNSKIEELEIIESKTVNEYESRIYDLEKKLNLYQDKAKPWSLNKWHSIIGISFLLIGGAFTFGYHFGNNKFDRSKNDLLNEIEILKDSSQKLNMEYKSLKNNLEECLIKRFKSNE